MHTASSEDCTMVLNNRAVALLRQGGDLSAAGELLRDALEGMRRLSEETPCADGKPHLSIALSFPQVAGPFLNDKEASSGMTTSSRSKDADATIYVHTQGILLEGLNAYSPDPLCNVSIVSGIILYNLALTNQLQGLRGAVHNDSCRLRRRLAERASSLYARSRWILSRVGITADRATGIATIDFLCLALVNNEAYAAFVQGLYAETQTRFTQLEALASSFRSMRPQWDEETLLLMDKYMRVFLLNTMFLQEPIIAASA